MLMATPFLSRWLVKDNDSVKDFLKGGSPVMPKPSGEANQNGRESTIYIAELVLKVSNQLPKTRWFGNVFFRVLNVGFLIVLHNTIGCIKLVFSADCALICKPAVLKFFSNPLIAKTKRNVQQADDCQ